MEITANVAGKGLARIEIQDSRISGFQVVGPTDPRRVFANPGFIDMQINGFGGVDFSDANLDAKTAISVLPAIWKTGVTSFCATLITNTIERLERNFRVLEEARRLDSRFAATVPCYHLEGPYLSPGPSHGAHDPALMQSPNWDQFLQLQDAAGGRIEIVTLAPELPGALDFIRRAKAAGLVVAISHTDGTPEDIHKAVEAGAEFSTHLGNGCPEWMPRHNNPVWAQIASDQLKATLICDGFHLPPDVVRTIYKAKGNARCSLVTDAVHVAGLPPGRYSLVGSEIELLPSGQVVTADRHSMAGSALAMNRAVCVYQDFAGASLEEALQAASGNPGRVLRRENICTDLAPGQPANLVLFRMASDALQIETVFLDGEPVYSRE